MSDRRRYDGKVVVVTGGAAGIGLGFVRGFAAEGASVVVADIDGAAAEEVAAGIDGSVAVAVNVADESSVEAMARTAVDRFGGVDVLVSNAGLHMGVYNQTVDLPLAEWRRLFDVNVFGAVLCARACRPSMAARGGGVILNQSSDSAHLGVGAYSVSKLALEGVTLSLAAELAADGVRVVGMAPGMTASDAVLERLDDGIKQMVLGGQMVKRFGTVEDLVPMALLLCSEEASMMTGQTVVVDGGFAKHV